MSQQPPRVFGKWLQRPIESGYLEGHARRDQPHALLANHMAINRYVFARDLFAFGVFLARQPGDARRRGCLDQPEFAKLPPKKAPRPYTKLCKLAGGKTHILGNATFTATGEFASHLGRFANSRRKRAAAGPCPPIFRNRIPGFANWGLDFLDLVF